MRLELDPAAGTATITDVYRHSPDVENVFAGNVHNLPNGNKLIGWGNVPRVTEFHADGTTALDMKLTNNSYRAHRFPWGGHPTEPPAAALRTNPDGTATVFASWSRATEVAEWQVLAGDSLAGLRPVGAPRSKAGFETALPLPAPAPVVRVQALDDTGAVLESSSPIFWSPATGAHAVHGRIRDRWSALGWETSYLGHPTSGEFGIPGGRRSDFQRGYVEWYAVTDTTFDRPY